MVMCVVAMLAGLEEFETAVLVQPHDSVTVLLDKLEQRFVDYKMPREFTGAYSIEFTNGIGLDEDDPDYIALEGGDPAVVAKYATSAARLDPTKTVRDYFGDHIENETTSVLLTWSPESFAIMKQERGRECGIHEAVVARFNAHKRENPVILPATAKNVSTEPEGQATSDTSASPCNWVVSTSPRATIGGTAKPLCVVAMLAGLEEFETAVLVQPHDSVTVLLDKLEQRFVDYKMPHEFTGAYSIEFTNGIGLDEDDLDYIALEGGDPAVVAKYATSAARLDPTKTVRDYFGDHIENETTSVLLTWSPESFAIMKQERGHERGIHDAVIARFNAHKRENAVTPPAVSAEATEQGTSETALAPWTWLTSWVSMVTMGASRPKARGAICDDAKKND